MTNNNLTDERLSALIRVARDSLELYEMELPVIDDVMLALAELQQRRAAMLQGADGNSPDGWVACSERMPETDGNYWGWWSESKRQGPVWFIKSELQEQFQSSEITSHTIKLLPI